MEDVTRTSNGSATTTSYTSESLTIEGAISNTGSIVLFGPDDRSSLLVGTATATLQGGGTVQLGDGDGDIIDAASKNGVLVNVDNMISGNGSLGSGNLVLQNQGTVDATGNSPLVVTLSTGATSSNTGTIEATGGGEIDVVRGRIGNAGTLDADGASDIEFANTATITNGTSGFIEATNGGAIYIDAVTRHAAFFANQGTIEAAAGSTVSVGRARRRTMWAEPSLVDRGRRSRAEP